MKNFNLIKRLFMDSHEKQSPQRFGRYAAMLIMLLTLGVGQMWAYWHVPGTHASSGWTVTDDNESCMDGSNYVTFYAVAAGTYEFKLVKGSDWGNGNFTNKSSSIITSVCSNCSNGNNKFVINTIADVTFHITDEGKWNCDISAVASSYFIKYPWGENHAWTFSAPMTACSDGTYACTGPYNGATYDFGRRGYAGGAGAKTGQTATVNNSPSTDETCVFNVTTSGALTITRCNKVTATNKIYFDNSVSNFTGNIYLIIGHDKPTKYSCAYKMTQLAGTKLHYVSIGANWTDATYYAIVGNSASSIDAGSWGSGDLSSKQTGGYSAAYTGKYDLGGSNKQYLFTTSSSGNNQALTITYKNTGYSNLNYTQSVTLCTKAYGAATYSANTSALTSLNFTTYNLTGVGSVSTQQTNNMNGSTGVASGSACQAATTTINVGDAPASWVYDGIYTDMNGGSQVEDDQEYTYYPTAATNYYVRFHEVHDPSVSLAASSSYLTTTSGLRALTGETITLTATALYNVNALVYTYEYSTNSGSSWTTIASRSASNTQTFVANSTGDYIFRVTLPDEAGTVNGTTNVHMTEMYRIKVKKNSSWTPNKLYVWNKSTEITQYGAFPGSTGKFTNHGQWYEFDLNSDFDSFIVSASDHNSNCTADVNNVSSDGCYTINSGTGTSVGVTSGATCPSAPTSVTTTNAPTLLQNNNATFAGSIGTNGNDDITSYGFKWGTSSDASNNTAQIATSDHTGSINKNVTGLTANTTYYYKAYATNAYGTSYGTIYSFTTPYKVTITKPTGCSAMTPGTGSQYVKVGDNITATKATGYTFSSWSTTNVTLGDPSTVAGVTTSAITAISADNGTITASYTENMTTITITANNKAAGSVTVGGADFEWDGTTTAGVATTRALVVTAAPGYYFSGWTRSDGADFHLSGYEEANTSVTLTGDGAGETEGQTLTANFVELEKIYFRDVFDDGSTVTHWGDVWVFLGITWSGVQAKTNESHDDWRIHMTQIGKTNTWWAYVPRNFTNAAAGTKEKIGFAKTNQNGRNYTFYNTKAATRGDYNKALNMFVPYHTAKYTGQNSVDYFDNGYWMKYDTRADQGAGYYLKRFNSKNNYTQEGEFIATNDDAMFIQFSLRIDQSNTTKYYMITSAGNLNYVADAAVTSGNCTNVGVSENLDDISKKEIKFALTTTAEGIYTFVLDQSGDKMKLNVIYPVSIGDYRLIHSYNDGSTKTSHSDVIKAADVSGTTVSMYLNMDAGTKDLKLYKCTAITDGKPVWGSNTTVGTGSGLFNTTTFNKGNGVYVFDVAIASNEVSTISNAGLYGGDYYIKTNSAPGGWANYKQNVMEKNTINFSKTNTSTFDYSMCKWISDITTNVKCVIANDYNNAISDTLVSDAILTRGGKAYETLPEAANVRFSYNSVTNELKRTYLKGSTGDTKFVVLVPQASGYVYSAAEGGTDYYSSKPKFADNGNWTYQMDAWVYPGAQAGVQTSYPTAPPVTVQTLVPLTNYLMGGTKGSNPRYHVRLVYDFKTDYLMSAWVAGGNITQAMDLKSDFIVVRNGQSAADQISFSGSGAISEAKRAYGVFEFSKSAMVGNMGSWNATSYGLCMYYFSFPFDVKVSDIFGIGAMGTDWRIQKYNGAKRAEKGWFLEDGTTTFWEDVTEDEVLNAYEGYSLLLNRINFNNGSNAVWTNIPADGHTYLYFPSKDAIGNIENQTNVTIHVPEHECTIDREFSQDIGVVEHPRNHKYTDSHWNMVGTPLFQNKVSNSLDNCVIGDSTIKYIYAWNSSDNTLSARSTLSTSHTFNAMYAYMVQYAGDVKFTGASIKASIAARQKKETKKYTLELELNKGERFAGRTYIELRENANDEFELNEDLYMMNSSKTADIYTFAGSYDVAANVLSVNDHIIPVGLNVKSAGTYTFSMTNSFDGEVILVDNYAQTRTNLLLEDYEIALPKGTCNDRFQIEINIKKVPTAIDGVEDGSGSLKDGKAHKFIENGQMYILQNGVIYDAQGKRVK